MSLNLEAMLLQDMEMPKTPDERAKVLAHVAEWLDYVELHGTGDPMLDHRIGRGHGMAVAALLLRQAASHNPFGMETSNA